MRAKLATHQDLTAEATKEQIRRGMVWDIRTLFDVKGNLRPIHTLTAEQAMPIAGFEVVQRNLTSGDGATDTVLKIKLVDRARYVEMAGRHHGLFVDKVDVSGALTLSEKVTRARQRLHSLRSARE